MFSVSLCIRVQALWWLSSGTAVLLLLVHIIPADTQLCNGIPGIPGTHGPNGRDGAKGEKGDPGEFQHGRDVTDYLCLTFSLMFLCYVITEQVRQVNPSGVRKGLRVYLVLQGALG